MAAEDPEGSKGHAVLLPSLVPAKSPTKAKRPPHGVSPWPRWGPPPPQQPTFWDDSKYAEFYVGCGGERAAMLNPASVRDPGMAPRMFAHFQKPVGRQQTGRPTAKQRAEFQMAFAEISGGRSWICSSEVRTLLSRLGHTLPPKVVEELLEAAEFVAQSEAGCACSGAQAAPMKDWSDEAVRAAAFKTLSKACVDGRLQDVLKRIMDEAEAEGDGTEVYEVCSPRGRGAKSSNGAANGTRTHYDRALLLYEMSQLVGAASTTDCNGPIVVSRAVRGAVDKFVEEALGGEQTEILDSLPPSRPPSTAPHVVWPRSGDAATDMACPIDEITSPGWSSCLQAAPKTKLEQPRSLALTRGLAALGRKVNKGRDPRQRQWLFNSVIPPIGHTEFAATVSHDTSSNHNRARTGPERAAELGEATGDNVSTQLGNQAPSVSRSPLKPHTQFRDSHRVGQDMYRSEYQPGFGVHRNRELVHGLAKVKLRSRLGLAI